MRSKSKSIHLPLHSEYSAKSQIIHIHRGYICNVYFKKEVLEKFAFQKKNFRQIKRTAYKFFFQGRDRRPLCKCSIYEDEECRK